MTDQKTSDLATGTLDDDNDLLMMVDVSDTTMAPSGTNKKTLWSAVKSALSALYAPISHTHVAGDIDAEASTDGQVLTSDGAGNAAWEDAPAGGGLPASLSQVPGKILIDTVDVTNVSSETINVSGYDEYYIEARLTSNQASNTYVDVRITLNGRPNSDHWRQSDTVSQTTSTAGYSNNEAVWGIISPAATGHHAEIRCSVPSRKGGTTPLQMFSESSSTRTAGSFNYFYQAVTGLDAGIDEDLSSFTLTPSTGTMSGQIKVYGIRDITLEDSETILTKVAVPATLTGGVLDVDLTGHQDGDRLIVEGLITGNAGADFDILNLYINEDTTVGNYTQQYNGVHSGTSQDSQRGATNKLSNITGGTSPSPGQLELKIEGYADTGNAKLVRSMFTGHWDTGNNMQVVGNAVASSVTDPVTRFRLYTDSGTLTGDVKAYIEKEGVIASTPLTASGPTEVPVVESGGDLVVDLTGHQDKTRVVLKGEIKSSISGVDTLQAWLNDDTTAGNYATQLHQVVGAIHQPYTGLNESTPGYCPGTAATNEYASIEWVIENYTRTDNVKIIKLTGNSAEGGGTLRHYTGSVKRKTVTDAVTKIAISGAGNITGNIKCYVED